METDAAALPVPRKVGSHPRCFLRSGSSWVIRLLQTPPCEMISCITDWLLNSSGTPKECNMNSRHEIIINFSPPTKTYILQTKLAWEGIKGWGQIHVPFCIFHVVFFISCYIFHLPNKCKMKNVKCKIEHASPSPTPPFESDIQWDIL